MMMAAVPPVATDKIMLTAMMEGTAWNGTLKSVDPELYSVLAPRDWGEGVSQLVVLLEPSTEVFTHSQHSLWNHS